MSVQMIVTDLDRTLLRSDKIISRYTAEALARCRQKGIKIVFATARPRRTAHPFCADTPIDALIVHNGAVVIVSDELLARFSIDAEVKDRILQAISKDHPKATLSVEIDDVLYANFDVSALWNDIQAVRTDFTDLPSKPADKIIVGVSDMKDIARYAKYLPDTVYIEMTDGKLGLMMSRDATKWNAIKAVAAHFRIPTTEIVAFGDDYNDIEMLKNCGVGVAVENALDEVKAVSDCICSSNDEDGVAKWLSAHIPDLFQM